MHVRKQSNNTEQEYINHLKAFSRNIGRGANMAPNVLRYQQIINTLLIKKLRGDVLESEHAVTF